ncbi:MAG: N-acetylmuramoyl-L-alanine amidase [Chloroflexi bacterium]|nr:N-acetylmuramoyl-L-alanine amidase [Chloroflexota bacterium]
MARWASNLLFLSMLAWTALTAAVGWTVLRGGPRAAASSVDAAVVYDVAAPGIDRQVHYLTRTQAAATLPQSEPTPAKRNLGRAQAPPRYSQSAGIGTKVKAADPATQQRARPAPRPAAKAVIVLDPGHGRGDPGATHYLPDGSGRWDVTEAESNLRNAELIRDNLVDMGYEVYLTRTGPGEGPGRPLPLQFITSDLYSRVALATSVDADLYLAIHGNGASVHSISGPETWYCGKHEEGAANEKLARMVQQAMMNGLHEYGYFPPNRGIMEDAERHHSGDFCQFVVTRETPVPSALLEFLFLSNDDDARVLADDRSHVLMARQVAQAIDAFMQSR